MTAGTVDNIEVVEVELDCGGLRGVVSGELGCGGRSVMARDSGKDDDDEHATASASTCKMPSSVKVHLS